MTRPLGSTPTAPSRGFTATTGRSASTPRDGTHCPLSAARQLPLAILEQQCQACLPTFRTEAADRAHVAYMPDTAWPESGHPPDSSRADLLHPGFDATLLSNDTSTANRLRSSSRSPPDASRAPFPHRSPRYVTVPAACGGLKPPPAGRLRRADNPSSPAQHRISKLSLHRAPFHVRDAPYGRIAWPPPRFGVTGRERRARCRAGRPRATGTATCR